MAVATNLLTFRRSVLTDSTLSSKTVNDVIVSAHASTVVIEVVDSSSVSHFIKVKQGRIDVGGDNQFGSGTLQLSNDGSRA